VLGGCSLDAGSESAVTPPASFLLGLLPPLECSLGGMILASLAQRYGMLLQDLCTAEPGTRRPAW